MSRRRICVDRTNQSLCDLEIIAGMEAGTGTENDNVQRTAPILATKVFLYGVSDKWKELIQSAVKTVPEDAVNVKNKDKVFIPEIGREILDNIVSFVYAGLRNEDEAERLPLDDDNVGKYFHAAQFLEMQDIETECLNYCNSKIITLDNFPVLFKWSAEFGKEGIQPRMSKFLKEHSEQIPQFIRRCKNKWNISESDVARMIIDWLSLSGVEISNYGVNMEHVIRQFSDKEEKIKLLDAFFEVGDPSEWSSTAFRLLKNLCKSGDRLADGTKEEKKNESRDSVNFPCGSNSAQGPVQNLADKQFLSSGPCEPPIKIRRMRNKDNSRISCSNSVVVELDREGENSPEQETDDEIEKESNSDDEDSSSSSPSRSSSSSSSFEAERTPKFKGKIYFLLKNQTSPGGFYLWSYNLKTHKSLREAKLPPSFQDRRKLAMVHRNKSIYFMGGEFSRTGGGATKEIDIFNVETGKWEERRKLKMLNPRFDFQACATRYVIYAVGGHQESLGEGRRKVITTNTVEEISYAPRKTPCGGWRGPQQNELACMESCRASAGIVALNSKVYAIGGRVWDRKSKNGMSASNLCERFDADINPYKGQWTAIAPMKYRRLGLAAVATPRPYEQRIYALGGSLQSPSAGTTDTDTLDNLQYMNTVEIYDPKKDSWTTGPPMKKQRAFFSAVYFNERIYALGGDSETKPTIEEFNLKTKQWALVGDLKEGGNFATVAEFKEYPW